MFKKINTEIKLKIMYLYTIFGAGGFGLMILIFPNLFISLLGMPIQDPIVLGITASVYLAFGILSILGLREPSKFVPVLLMQFTYKTIWFIGVIIPLAIIGILPSYAIIQIIIFATYIIGDILAIPWSKILEKQ